MPFFLFLHRRVTAWATLISFLFGQFLPLMPVSATQVLVENVFPLDHSLKTKTLPLPSSKSLQPFTQSGNLSSERDFLSTTIRDIGKELARQRVHCFDLERFAHISKLDIEVEDSGRLSFNQKSADASTDTEDDEEEEDNEPLPAPSKQQQVRHLLSSIFDMTKVFYGLIPSEHTVTITSPYPVLLSKITGGGSLNVIAPSIILDGHITLADGRFTLSASKDKDQGVITSSALLNISRQLSLKGEWSNKGIIQESSSGGHKTFFYDRFTNQGVIERGSWAFKGSSLTNQAVIDLDAMTLEGRTVTNYKTLSAPKIEGVIQSLINHSGGRIVGEQGELEISRAFENDGYAKLFKVRGGVEVNNQGSLSILSDLLIDSLSNGSEGTITSFRIIGSGVNNRGKIKTKTLESATLINNGSLKAEETLTVTQKTRNTGKLKSLGLMTLLGETRNEGELFFKVLRGHIMTHHKGFCKGDEASLETLVNRGKIVLSHLQSKILSNYGRVEVQGLQVANEIRTFKGSKTIAQTLEAPKGITEGALEATTASFGALNHQGNLTIKSLIVKGLLQNLGLVKSTQAIIGELNNQSQLFADDVVVERSFKGFLGSLLQALVLKVQASSENQGTLKSNQATLQALTNEGEMRVQHLSLGSVTNGGKIYFESLKALPDSLFKSTYTGIIEGQTATLHELINNGKFTVKDIVLSKGGLNMSMGMMSFETLKALTFATESDVDEEELTLTKPVYTVRILEVRENRQELQKKKEDIEIQLKNIESLPPSAPSSAPSPNAAKIAELTKYLKELEGSAEALEKSPLGNTHQFGSFMGLTKKVSPENPLVVPHIVEYAKTKKIGLINPRMVRDEEERLKKEIAKLQQISSSPSVVSELDKLKKENRKYADEISSVTKWKNLGGSRSGVSLPSGSLFEREFYRILNSPPYASGSNRIEAADAVEKAVVPELRKKIEKNQNKILQLQSQGALSSPSSSFNPNAAKIAELTKYLKELEGTAELLEKAPLGKNYQFGSFQGLVKNKVTPENPLLAPLIAEYQKSKKIGIIHPQMIRDEEEKLKKEIAELTKQEPQTPPSPSVSIAPSQAQLNLNYGHVGSQHYKISSSLGVAPDAAPDSPAVLKLFPAQQEDYRKSWQAYQNAYRAMKGLPLLTPSESSLSRTKDSEKLIGNDEGVDLVWPSMIGGEKSSDEEQKEESLSKHISLQMAPAKGVKGAGRVEGGRAVLEVFSQTKGVVRIQDLEVAKELRTSPGSVLEATTASFGALNHKGVLGIKSLIVKGLLQNLGLVKSTQAIIGNLANQSQFFADDLLVERSFKGFLGSVLQALVLKVQAASENQGSLRSNQATLQALTNEGEVGVHTLSLGSATNKGKLYFNGLKALPGSTLTSTSTGEMRGKTATLEALINHGKLAIENLTLSKSSLNTATGVMEFDVFKAPTFENQGSMQGRIAVLEAFTHAKGAVCVQDLQIAKELQTSPESDLEATTASFGSLTHKGSLKVRSLIVKGLAALYAGVMHGKQATIGGLQNYAKVFVEDLAVKGSATSHGEMGGKTATLLDLTNQGKLTIENITLSKDGLNAGNAVMEFDIFKAPTFHNQGIIQGRIASFGRFTNCMGMGKIRVQDLNLSENQGSWCSENLWTLTQACELSKLSLETQAFMHKKGDKTFPYALALKTRDFKILSGSISFQGGFLCRSDSPIQIGANNSVMATLMATEGGITLEAPSIDCRYGKVCGAGDVSMTTVTSGSISVGESAQGDNVKYEAAKFAEFYHSWLRSNGAFVASNGTLSLTTGNIYLNYGELFSTGNMVIKATTLDSLSGLMKVGGDLSVQGMRLKLTRAPQVYTYQAADVFSKLLVESSGPASINVLGNGYLAVNNIDIMAGHLCVSKNLQVLGKSVSPSALPSSFVLSTRPVYLEKYVRRLITPGLPHLVEKGVYNDPAALNPAVLVVGNALRIQQTDTVTFNGNVNAYAIAVACNHFLSMKQGMKKHSPAFKGALLIDLNEIAKQMSGGFILQNDQGVIQTAFPVTSSLSFEGAGRFMIEDRDSSQSLVRYQSNQLNIIEDQNHQMVPFKSSVEPVPLEFSLQKILAEQIGTLTIGGKTGNALIRALLTKDRQSFRSLQMAVENADQPMIAWTLQKMLYRPYLVIPGRFINPFRDAGDISCNRLAIEAEKTITLKNNRLYAGEYGLLKSKGTMQRETEKERTYYSYGESYGYYDSPSSQQQILGGSEGWVIQAPGLEQIGTLTAVEGDLTLGIGEKGAKSSPLVLESYNQSTRHSHKKTATTTSFNQGAQPDMIGVKGHIKVVPLEFLSQESDDRSPAVQEREAESRDRALDHPSSESRQITFKGSKVYGEKGIFVKEIDLQVLPQILNSLSSSHTTKKGGSFTRGYSINSSQSNQSSLQAVLATGEQGAIVLGEGGGKYARLESAVVEARTLSLLHERTDITGAVVTQRMQQTTTQSWGYGRSIVKTDQGHQEMAPSVLRVSRVIMPESSILTIDDSTIISEEVLKTLRTTLKDQFIQTHTELQSWCNVEQSSRGIKQEHVSALAGITAGVLTGGAGFFVVDSGIPAVMVNAGLSGLCSAGASSLVKNNGNIGRTFKDLASSKTLKSIAVTMASAGILEWIDFNPGVIDSDGVLHKSFIDHLHVNLLRQAISVPLNIVVLHQDPEKALRQGGILALANTISSYGAQEIGQAYNMPDSEMDYLGHKLLHGLNGGVAGLMMDSSFKGFSSGALGAMVIETLMDDATYGKKRGQGALEKVLAKQEENQRLLTPEEFKKEYQKTINEELKAAKLTSTAITTLLSQEPTISFVTGSNASENNAIPGLISAGLVLYTAYDLYYTLHTEGLDAALTKLAIEGSISLVTLGAGKVIWMVAGKKCVTASAAWAAYLDANPVTRVAIEKVVNPLVKGYHKLDRALEKNGFGSLFDRSGPKLLGGSGQKAVEISGGKLGNSNVSAQKMLQLQPPRMVKHHIFNKFRGESHQSQKYREFFKEHNIDVDKYTIEIPATMHTSKIHTADNNWTTKWKIWIDNNPHATTKEVYQFGGTLMEEYGVNHLPLFFYKK